MRDIDKAVNVLRQGGLVAMPTETVYGLAANAKNPQALDKIFQVKQRPVDHPLIVHLAGLAHLEQWASRVPDAAWHLADAFWPGPLTLVLPKAAHVSDKITGKQPTVALRVPAHPVAHALLKAFGDGIAAPSANRFGRISPTTAAAVYEELGQTVDLILDGGQCEVGVESTIVDVSGEQPVILRPGMITAAQIEVVLQQSLSDKKNDSPRVSGMMKSHYAPQAPARCLTFDEISIFLSRLTESDLPLAVVVFDLRGIEPHEGVEWVVMPNDPTHYAHDLYATLRRLDKKNPRLILIEQVPATPEWLAVRDRLMRAANLLVTDY
jgi:L-threonylcarbamoyladenylate synthase